VSVLFSEFYLALSLLHNRGFCDIDNAGFYSGFFEDVTQALARATETTKGCQIQLNYYLRSLHTATAPRIQRLHYNHFL